MLSLRPYHNARYAKLRRQIGKINFNIIICLACHTWHTCASPEPRHIQSTQKVVKIIRDSLCCVNFGVENCVNSPKRSFCKLDIVKRPFPGQQYTWLGVYGLVDIAHNSAASKNWHVPIWQVFVVSSISDSQNVSQLSFHTRAPT